MTHCSACLEEVSTVELNGQETPCCQSPVTNEIGLYVLPDDGVTIEEIKAYVSTMSPDSKKRRKTYDKKPKNTWPGKLSDRGIDYKASKKTKKSAPPPKASKNTSYVNLTKKINIKPQEQWQVKITGLSKKPHIIYGENRQDARRKARSYIRDMGSSITVANSITDLENTTEIEFK